MINRNEDAILLSGLSDEVLARKVLDFARRTADEKNVSERDGSVGETLTRIVPYLAQKFGAEVTPDEVADRGKRDQYISEEFRVKEMAKEIMAASMYESSFPGNALLADPAKGNPVATLLDRYMDKIGMPKAIGPNGENPEPKWGVGSIRSGYVGADAVPTTVIAEHMLKKTAEMGHHPVPYWAPGHTEEMRRAEPGSLGERLWDRLTPETRLMSLNEQAYSRRLHALPDKELAAEMMEQARDTRERHDLKVDDRSGYHRYMTWHGVPAMAALFGQEMTADERSHYDHRTKVGMEHAASRREEYKPFTDQQHFDGMSSAVLNGFAEGSRYLIDTRGDSGVKPTLAERVMFNEPTNGNSMVILLDRMAKDLDVVRGQEYDLIGRRIAERTDRRQEDYEWKPKPLVEAPSASIAKEVEPANDVAKTAITPARAAAMSQALGRGI